MHRTHNITTAPGNPRQLFVEIVEHVAGASGIESKIVTSGTFDTKRDAYVFIDAWGARRIQRIDLDPTRGGILQTRLAGSRRA